MSPLMFLMLVTMARSQETTPDYTVTYNPGQDCLPYDGSVVPDCSKFVDPITKFPYYHPHSYSKMQLDLQSAGSSPNLIYTKLSARDAIMIP